MERPANFNIFKNAHVAGFSLLEMLIVMAIMGIILTISTVSYLTIQQRGRDARRRTDIEQLRTALEIYRSQNGIYPSIAASNTWITAAPLNNPLVTPGYMRSIPTDPNQNATFPYWYKSWNSWQNYCIAANFEQPSTVSQCVGPNANYDYRIVNP